MKKSVVLSVALFLLAVTVHAQSAEKVSEIIKSPNATYGQLAYLAGVCKQQVSDSASYDQAFDTLQKAGVIPATAKSTDKVTLADASLLCAQAADVKGGLFYTLFGNARYAYKELKAKGVLPQTADSSMNVSGRDVIGILNGCISLTEGAQ